MRMIVRDVWVVDPEVVTTVINLLNETKGWKYSPTNFPIYKELNQEIVFHIGPEGQEVMIGPAEENGKFVIDASRATRPLIEDEIGIPLDSLEYDEDDDSFLYDDGLF